MASEQRMSPTVRQRRLAALLRRQRESADLMGTDVQEQTDISPARLSRIESGRYSIRPQEVRLLAGTYGVTSADMDALLQLARDSRQKGWWDPYRKKGLGEDYSTYIGLESEASELLTYEQVVPGLFQTLEYARALIKGGPAELPAGQLDNRVDVRIQRQQILFGESPLRIWAIMDEAALRRPIGGTDVHQKQMERLLELADEPKIIMQVLPFAIGAHPATAGSFTVIQFPEVVDTNVVYVETIAGELFVEDVAEVAEYERSFQYLTANAMSPEDTLALIARVASRQD